MDANRAGVASPPPRPDSFNLGSVPADPSRITGRLSALQPCL